MELGIPIFDVESDFQFFKQFLSIDPELKKDDSQKNDSLYNQVQNLFWIDPQKKKVFTALPDVYSGILKTPLSYYYDKENCYVKMYGNEYEIIRNLTRAIANICLSVSRNTKDINMYQSISKFLNETSHFYTYDREHYFYNNTQMSETIVDQQIDYIVLNSNYEIEQVNDQTYPTMQQYFNSIIEWLLDTHEHNVIVINVNTTYTPTAKHSCFALIYPKLKVFSFFNPWFNINYKEEQKVFKSFQVLQQRNFKFLRYSNIMHQIYLQDKFEDKCFYSGVCLTASAVIKYLCATLNFWFPGIIATILSSLIDRKVIDVNKLLFGLRGYLFTTGNNPLTIPDLPFQTRVFNPQRKSTESLIQPVRKLALGGKKKRSRRKRSI